MRYLWAEERHREQRQYVLAMLLALLVFLLCCCFRANAYSYEKKFVPLEYLKNYALALRVLFGKAVPPASGEARVLYLGALSRLRSTAMAFLAGAGLSLAGAVFQNAWRNPMASPGMLGATAGVRLGNVLLISMFSVSAVEHLSLRYFFCYGFSAVCVGIVLLLGKLAGGRRRETSVLEMVMAGSVLSSGLNVVTMYLMYQLEDEALLLYEELSYGMYEQTDAVSTGIFFTVMLLSLIPLLLLRTRMNLLSADRLEGSALGIRPGVLRMIAQLCGVILTTCAMIHCGELGMISLVVPHVVRRYAGADMRRVCVFGAAAGGILMMLARLLGSFFQILSEPIPVAFFINLLLLPAFVLILARQRGELT
ncbi:MAG: iron ABC transporter permease [Oscillospiraceae bacterium]|nr:iron ABC transporter permease [Oscillospiraceae bacterium]